MTDKMRRQAARMLREMLDEGTHRKEAIYKTVKWVRGGGFRCSRTTLYAWCKRFGVSTR